MRNLVSSRSTIRDRRPRVLSSVFVKQKGIITIELSSLYKFGGFPHYALQNGTIEQQMLLVMRNLVSSRLTIRDRRPRVVEFCFYKKGRVTGNFEPGFLGIKVAFHR